MGSSVDLQKVLHYLPNGCDIYSDDQRQAELAKLAGDNDNHSQATPNLTPAHKSLGQRSVDLKGKQVSFKVKETTTGRIWVNSLRTRT